MRDREHVTNLGDEQLCDFGRWQSKQIVQGNESQDRLHSSSWNRQCLLQVILVLEAAYIEYGVKHTVSEMRVSIAAKIEKKTFFSVPCCAGKWAMD